MKKEILLILALFLLFSMNTSIAQENQNESKYVDIQERIDAEVLKLRKQAERHEEKEKDQLKKIISKINSELENGTIIKETADKRKKEAAQKSAKSIVAYNKLMEAKIDYMVARKDINENSFWLELNPIDYQVSLFNENNRKYKKYKRTVSGFVLGFGYNYWKSDEVGIDDFSYKNNNFFQAGYQFTTRLDKDKGLLRVKYGLDMILHSTELNGNRTVSIGGSNTNIQPIGFKVKKAQFTQVQFVAPIHFVIGGSSRKDYEDGRVRFDYFDQWELGIGGFVGFNTSSTLRFKFKQDGRTVRQETTNAFDTNPFVYGLDAYVAKGGISLFGRMNLNNVFKSNSVDAQYVSFGIRFQ